MFPDAARDLRSRNAGVYAQIIDDLSEGIAIHDRHVIEQANAAAAALLGFASVDELIASTAIGNTAVDNAAIGKAASAPIAIFDEAGTAVPAAELWAANSQERIVRVVRTDRDGSERWIALRTRALAGADGERFLTSLRDVSDRRRAQDAERARTQLVEILDSITDPFTVYDRELRIISCNQSAARLVGRSASELVGKRPWDLVPEAKNTPFVRAYETVLRTQRAMSIEEYFEPWQRWYEANIYPLHDGIAVQSKDVTIRKHALELTARLGRHAALRAEVSIIMSEERHLPRMLQRCCEAIVDQLEVAFARVWTLDEPAQTLLLQASAGMYTHLDGPHRAVPVGKFKIGRIAASHKPHLTNDVLHDKQIGDPAWAAREKMVAFAGYPLLVDQRVIGVLAMFSRSVLPEDTMTAIGTIADLIAQGIVRRRTEMELEQRVTELARSNAELEQFAYVASHDLQEPLRMVASYNQLLARRYKGKLDADADEFIAYTVEGVTRMQRLINDLLAYSRLGTRSAERTAVELEVVLAATLSNLERAIAESDAVITHDRLPLVWGNEGQLVQLLQNLVGNAIKFRGEDRPQIHISATETPRDVTIAVRDNGIGIEPQYFDRIFVIFQRLNPREKYPGTGIGLAICKKIVERHGGRIWVESMPGKGSTVKFSIPRSQRSAS